MHATLLHKLLTYGTWIFGVGGSGGRALSYIGVLVRAHAQLHVTVAACQGAARTPEELLSSAVELLLLGLLKKQTFADLCTSLGLAGDALQSLLLRTDTASEMTKGGTATSLPLISHGGAQKQIADLAAQVQSLT